MLQSIMKLLVYAALGILVLIGALVVALFTWTPSDHASPPDRSAPQSYTVPLSGAASAPSVNPNWPGADFPSSAWRDSELEWYVQWKRVHKYARIAFQTSQPSGFAPLSKQARELYAHVAGWSDGRAKSACLQAAEQLHKALLALVDNDAGGYSALQASEPAGDKCRSAAQAASRRR